MANIELVIKIDEKIIQQAKNYHDLPYDDYVIRVAEAIAKGIPLPKGHGRLIEVNENLYQEIRKWVGVGMASELLDNAPTIVAEDKESEE